MCAFRNLVLWNMKLDELRSKMMDSRAFFTWKTFGEMRHGRGWDGLCLTNVNSPAAKSNYSGQGYELSCPTT